MPKVPKPISSTGLPACAGLLEAVLESVTVFQESPRLLADPAAQAGEAALAAHAQQAAMPAATVPSAMYRSTTARHISGASSAIARGIVAGAAAASGALSRQLSSLRPAEPKQQPVAVPEGLRRRLQQTASITAWLSRAAEGAISALGWLGAKLAVPVLWALGMSKTTEPGQEPGECGSLKGICVSSATDGSTTCLQLCS